jgi:uncharacterized protein (DUF1800 family)
MAAIANLGLLALNRFGYGPRGDGDTAIAASDPRGFLKAELAQPGIALLSGAALPATAAATASFNKDQAERKAERDQLTQQLADDAARAKQLAALGAVSPVFAKLAKADAEKAAALVANPPKPPAKPPSPEQIIFRDEALARLRRAIEARAGFAERLVAFWSNHFCVSANKGGIARSITGSFEREAIRPHVLGKFSDMLIAVETHPAMLHFLDNVQSIGPNSKIGLKTHKGLNENLGREIMELHTLGVGSGYTQADVTNLARIITGWSIANANGKEGVPGTFFFHADAHEPGPIGLLGKFYLEDGVAQGKAALGDIARRPETAKFIAAKFARAFVSDQPPLRLTAHLADVFRRTDGDLHAMTLALIDDNDAWAPGPGKVRTPYEFIIAASRLTGHLPDEPGQVLGPLNLMGMGLWTPPGPNGYADSIAAWASPEGMKLRLDYCSQVASKLRDPPNPSDLLEAMCGANPSAPTREAVARAESRQQGLALLLMSPEMQWR